MGAGKEIFTNLELIPIGALRTFTGAPQDGRQENQDFPLRELKLHIHTWRSIMNMAKAKQEEGKLLFCWIINLLFWN